jgi:hypothetical protein
MAKLTIVLLHFHLINLYSMTLFFAIRKWTYIAENKMIIVESITIFIIYKDLNDSFIRRRGFYITVVKIV